MRISFDSLRNGFNTVRNGGLRKVVPLARYTLETEDFLLLGVIGSALRL